MDNDAKNKKSLKKTIDILTIAGIIAGILFVIFGITFTLPPSEPTPPDQNAMLESEYQTALQSYETSHAKWELSMKQAESLGLFRFGNLGGFVDIPSVAITIGGCFAALMIAFPASVYTKFPVWISICFHPCKYDPHEYVDQILKLAQTARTMGLLALENIIEEIVDPFMRSSVSLVVDSVAPEKIKEVLDAEMDKLTERHSVAWSFMDQGGALAPAFGMIGTLIGLINMLKDMSDPNSIGPAMAVALLTTLYGCLVANLFFAPLSKKLGIRHDEEYLCRELIVEGMLSIQAGENPRFIEEKLNLMLIAKKKGRKTDNKKESTDGSE